MSVENEDDEFNTHHSTDDEHASGLADMLSRGNYIELLIRTSVTCLGLHWDQVLAEIARGRVDEETRSVVCLDGDP